MVLEVLVYLTFGQIMVSQRFQEVPRAGSGRMLGGRRKKKKKKEVEQKEEEEKRKLRRKKTQSL